MIERIGRRPATSDRLTLGLTLAGVLFAGLVALLDGGALGTAVAGVSVLGLLAACWIGSARAGYAASAGLLVATLFTDVTPVLGLGPILVLGVGGPLWVTIVALIPHLDPEEVRHPTPPSRGYVLRFVGLAAIVAATVVAPLVFTPVQIALSSEMGSTLAILLVAGAAILIFGPPLVALQAGRVEVDADELVERNVRFGYIQHREE